MMHRPHSHQHHCSTFQLVVCGCVMLMNAYSAYSCWCLQVRTPHPHRHHRRCCDATLSTTLLLMQSCWPQNAAAVITALLNYILCVHVQRGGTVYMFNCALALLLIMESYVHTPTLLCMHCSFCVRAYVCCMFVSEVSLEINPLHLVFNEGPKEREEERGP